MSKTKFIKKKSFIFFHLNLFFSSLPVGKRIIVINKCYWPLLQMVEECSFPIGIELTGWTLKEIQKLDKRWIKKFKKLLNLNKTYLIGSSYTQAIFPLIPHEVNDFNIREGNKIYKKILNYIPTTAYVNEQCYSKSVVDLYKKNKFKNLILDWDSFNKNKQSKLKYFPQRLKGNSSTIGVIWNSSSNFQNFQKVVNSKIVFSDYLKVFQKTNNFKEGIVSIYGSDAEIFDFRLKRYEHEEKIDSEKSNEWKNIKKILKIFERKFNFVNLNNIEKIKFKSKNKNKLLDINRVENILPTKKQKKYNPLRWYVGGIDNYTANTLCWRIFQSSKKNRSQLKKLCFYWSSDFRTHIEKKRWNEFFLNLKKETKKYKKIHPINNIKKKKNYYLYELYEDKNIISYKDKSIFFDLDKKKGLNLINFGAKKNNIELPYLKKFDQGDFRAERLNADLYNGHNVVENPKLKFTDLDKSGKINIKKKNNFLIFKNSFYIKKKILINKDWYFDLEKKILYLCNEIKLFDIEFLSIRSNYLNLNYEMFDLNKLKILTKNGGKNNEVFSFKDSKNFFYDDPLSSKFTAHNCFGNTGGNVQFNDGKHVLNLNIFQENGSCAPMLNFLNDGYNKYFLRFLTTFRENNDTTRLFVNKKYQSLMSIDINK